jgi:hypothetical protein
MGYETRKVDGERFSFEGRLKQPDRALVLEVEVVCTGGAGALGEQFEAFFGKPGVAVEAEFRARRGGRAAARAEGERLCAEVATLMQARLPPTACLGLTARNVSELDAEARGALDVASGVLVGEVTDDGPAQRAGLASWDVVLGIDGLETPDSGVLRRALHGREPGDRVSLLVSRKGETLSPSLVLGERGDEGECRAGGGATEIAEPAVPTPLPDRLVFGDVLVRPQPVPAETPFAVELAVEVVDSSAGGSDVEVTLRVEILRDGEVLYEPAPETLSCRNGAATEVVKHLRAGSDPGRYELRLTAAAGQLRDQQSVVFEIR